MAPSLRRPNGCSVCKDTHVKCDLEKPSCRRCVRLRLRCPGYADHWESLHRQQNRYAATLVQDRVHKQLEWRRQTLSTVTKRAQTGPQKCLNQDYSQYSVQRLYMDYSFTAFINLFAALPVLSCHQPSACYTHSLKALGLASASGHLQQSGLMARARSSYSMATGALREAISNHNSLRDDSVLAAIFLLGFYEIIVQQISSSRMKGHKLNCRPHAEGAHALVLHRVQNGLDTLLDVNLFLFRRNIRLMEVFMQNREMSSLEEDFERPWSGWPNFPALEPVTKKSIDVFTELLKASNEGVPSIVKAFEIINSALTVAEELECKAAGVTAYSTGAHFNGLIPVSSPASVAIAKVHYLTIRFHILDMLHVAFGSHVCLEWFQSQPIESERGCELWQQIEKSLEEDGGNRKKTANSASSNGMPFRAVFCLSWPLLAIAQSSFSSEDLRLAAQERLRYGAKVSGFLGPSDTKE